MPETEEGNINELTSAKRRQLQHLGIVVLLVALLGGFRLLVVVVPAFLIGEINDSSRALSMFFRIWLQSAVPSV